MRAIFNVPAPSGPALRPCALLGLNMRDGLKMKRWLRPKPA
jgi:hypothetical protein